MKSTKSEETQSRREFFKSAAKAALPILGVAVLANIPSVKTFASTECDGCYGGCTGSCTGTCHGSCKTGCGATCEGTCYGSCHGSCGDLCR